MLVLYGAGLGWWGSRNIEYVVFALNIALLFGWGLLAARAAGRTWRAGVKLGVADGLLGVIVVVANAVCRASGRAGAPRDRSYRRGAGRL
ncbi:hypothetical protein [Streptomyces violascens]|uniref:hypothetical protein n=1 Tax=Streptomyces violascens TaxID=67381 RepID=UPI0036BBB3E8